MKGVVKVIDQISDILAEDKNPGDDDDVLEYDQATIIVGTTDTRLRDNITFDSKQGMVNLPNMNHLFPNNTQNCTDNKVRCILYIFSSV